MNGITTQKVTLGQGSKEFSKKNTRIEFQKIINYTDQDPEHKKILKRLDAKICRYKEIYPYEKNIVEISNDHKYVNASYMHIFFLNSFIASQGPNDNTVDDFWQMCFEKEIKKILMLCKETEDNKKKCSNYWDKDMKANMFENKETKVLYSDNIIEEKTITILNKKDGKIKTFPHIQFKEWPDHTTPNIENYVQLFQKLFDFVGLMKEKEPEKAPKKEKRNEGEKEKEFPILVHCSAGIGRTGVFLTLYAICYEIDKQIKSRNSDVISFNIFNFVRKLKEMRMFSVENINQYNFIYKFIEEYLREKNIPNPINKIL